MRLRAWLRQRWTRGRIGRRLRPLAAARLWPTRFDHPQLIEPPPASRALVLSPHPDDGVLGAGGTLLRQQQAGCRVVELVLTDGGAGVPALPRAEAVATRRREEEAAAARLGFERVIFWDEPDGALAASRASADRLRMLLEEVRPECVYLPWFLDPHPDHGVVTALLARAVASRRPSFRCVAYESWAPLLPNALVDVSAQMDAKLRAVAEYRSQLAQAAYDDLARARARWRSGAFSRDLTYVEAFYVDPVDAYLALWRAATAGRFRQNARG